MEFNSDSAEYLLCGRREARGGTHRRHAPHLRCLHSCMVNLCAKVPAMATEKTISMSSRVSPRFKSLLEVAADRENRSLPNILETLAFAHCDKLSLKELSAKTGKAKGATKRRKGQWQARHSYSTYSTASSRSRR